MTSEERGLHMIDALLEHLWQVQEQTATMIESLQKERDRKTGTKRTRRSLRFAVAGRSTRQPLAFTRCTY